MVNEPLNYFQRLHAALDLIDQQAVDQIIGHLDALRRARRQLYICGNGGSDANAAHLVAHLQELGIRATDLMADIPALTALSNDVSYAQALQRKLRSLASAGQGLLVITGSGDSPNIIMALAEAGRIGMLRLGLLGFDGGIAKGLCDTVALVPIREYGPIEDCHSAIIHALAGSLRLDKPLERV